MSVPLHIGHMRISLGTFILCFCEGILNRLPDFGCFSGHKDDVAANGQQEFLTCMIACHIGEGCCVFQHIPVGIHDKFCICFQKFYIALAVGIDPACYSEAVSVSCTVSTVKSSGLNPRCSGSCAVSGLTASQLSR